MCNDILDCIITMSYNNFTAWNISPLISTDSIKRPFCRPRNKQKHSKTLNIHGIKVYAIFSYSGPSGILGSDGKQNIALARARGC